MLKLEKFAKSDRVQISLREKTKFWNKTFLQAFFLAFIFHLSAVIIFKVKPFFISEVKTIFPPVSVNTNINDQSQNGALAKVGSEASKRNDLPVPLIIPVLPDIVMKDEDYPVFLPDETYFEELDFEEDSQSVAALNPLFSVPIKVDLQGEIAHLHLNKQNFEIKLRGLPGKKPIVYTVTVDGQEGKIIDYKAEGDPYKELSDQFVSILEEMEFDGNELYITFTGELIFRLSDS